MPLADRPVDFSDVLTSGKLVMNMSSLVGWVIIGISWKRSLRLLSVCLSHLVLRNMSIKTASGMSTRFGAHPHIVYDTGLGQGSSWLARKDGLL